jgi:pimeloyl-ACP methyl ester carboxylesterase
MGADNLVEFGLTMAGREYIEPFARHVAEEMLAASREDFANQMLTLLSAPDQTALEGPMGDHMHSSLPTNFAQGAAGWVDDDLAFATAFGFEPSSIAIPAPIVHGVHDRCVPVEHGRWLAANVPGAESWILEEDGHLSLLTRHVPAVHAWLLAHMAG